MFKTFFPMLSLFVLVILCGCATEDSAVGSYMADKNYTVFIAGDAMRKAVAYNGVERNPVIVIHGFLGAKLRDSVSGRNVWGEMTFVEAVRPMTPLHMADMALPLPDGAIKAIPGDNVRPAAMLTKFKVKFGAMEFQVDGYDRLINLLEQAGYRSEDSTLDDDTWHPDLFVYAYDWRRDIAENAAKLQRFIAVKKKMLQQKYEKIYGLKDYDVRFDIIAHSMGGLVARYSMLYGNQVLPDDGSLPKPDWRGAADIDRAILVGTPNAGYVDSCVELVSGLNYARGAAPLPAGIIGTFQSCYQMMPHKVYEAVADEKGQPIDMFDVNVWRRNKWGMLDPAQDYVLQILMPDVKTRRERYRIAARNLEFRLRKAKQLQASLSVFVQPPEWLTLQLFLGDSVRTGSRAVYKDGKLRIVDYDSGDGKVTALSARGDLRNDRMAWHPYELSPIVWSGVVHLPGAHMGIIQNNIFRDNVLYYLLCSPDKKDLPKVKKMVNAIE